MKRQLNYMLTEGHNSFVLDVHASFIATAVIEPS